MQDKKSDLDRAIYKLYAYYDVYTDTALSEKMSISRSAISQWRYKGVIPKKILSKYDKIISGDKEEIVVEAETIHIDKGEDKIFELKDGIHCVGNKKKMSKDKKKKQNKKKTKNK